MCNLGKDLQASGRNWHSSHKPGQTYLLQHLLLYNRRFFQVISVPFNKKQLLGKNIIGNQEGFMALQSILKEPMSFATDPTTFIYFKEWYPIIKHIPHPPTPAAIFVFPGWCQSFLGL